MYKFGPFNITYRENIFQEQYLFIYKALAEWYMFGETDIEVGQFREHYRLLNEPQLREQQISSNRSAFSVIVKRPVSKLQQVNSDTVNSEKIQTAMEAEYKVFTFIPRFYLQCFSPIVNSIMQISIGTVIRIVRLNEKII